MYARVRIHFFSLSPPPTASHPAVQVPLRAIAEDDRIWFQEEVQVHERILRAYLRRKFPQLTDIDDVVQESYLRLLRARVAGRLRSAKGFLFTAARNAAIDLFRHRAVVPMEVLTEENTSSVYSSRADAAEAASLNQDLEILAAALGGLPDRCRQILILRRIQGLSHHEIAKRLSISEHTVEKQVGIGLRKCVEFVQRHGVEGRKP